MLSPDTLKQAQTLWDYHKLNHQLKKADVIIVMGSHDTRAAEKAAELFIDGYAQLIVCSGGIGKITEDWTEPEAAVFAKIIESKGVSNDHVLRESKSSNTGENILLTKQLLADKGIYPKAVILVHKPYMERRSYATCKKLWPEVECLVTSPDLTLETYPFGDRTIEHMVHIMAGDLQRLKEYVSKGFMIQQDIPADVWDAYEKLVEKGYTDYLIAK